MLRSDTHYSDTPSLQAVIISDQLLRELPGGCLAGARRLLLLQVEHTLLGVYIHAEIS